MFTVMTENCLGTFLVVTFLVTFILFGSNRGLLIRRLILFLILILSLALFKIGNISNIAMQGFSKKETIVELCIIVQTK